METSVRVSPSAPLGAVNRLVLGQNAEWYDFTFEPLWEDGSIRADVLDQIREMGPVSIRYPGGCPGDYFRWEQTLGPRTGRSKQINPFADRWIEPWLGVDELLDMCAAVGAAPWLQTNPVNETGSDVARWASHCRDRGVPVSHWELGNEIYAASPDDHNPTSANNARIAMTPQVYVEKTLPHLEALKEADPDCIVGSIGGLMGPGIWPSPPLASDWHEQAVGRLEVDYLAIHSFYGPTVGDAEWWTDPSREDLEKAYVACGAMPLMARLNLDANLKMLDELAPGRDVKLAVTEWLPLFGFWGDTHSLAGTAGTIPYTAGNLHVMLREPRVLAAHWMSFVQPSWGACLAMTPQGLRPGVHHAVFSLYARHLGDQVVGVEVTGDTYEAPPMGNVTPIPDFPQIASIPVVDALATVSGSRTTIFLTNRDLHLDRMVTIDGLDPSAGVVAEGAWGDHWLEANGHVVTGLGVRERPADDPVRIRPVPVEGHPCRVRVPACGVVAVTQT